MGCPCSWKGWLVFLQMTRGWEKKPVHNLLRKGLGRKGLTEQVHLRRKEERIQIRLGNQDRSITCGNYATSSSDFSEFQSMFSHRTTCLPMLPMMKYKAACTLARKGGDWADCPNTFSKDLLIKTLLCGSIFRYTS